MTGPVHPDWERDGADWPNREHSNFVQAGGIRWHYQRMGAGPTLLLLHGAGAATHSWRDLVPLLAQDFDVIAPDLPGHGFTRIQSRRQCSLPAMADGVSALMQSVEADAGVIVGHSAGTAIALDCVLNGRLAPSRVIGMNAALTPFRGIAGVLFPPLAKLLALNPVVPRAFAALAGGDGQVRRLIAGTGSTIDDRGIALYAKLIKRSPHVDGALSMMALWNLDDLVKEIDRLTVPVDLIVGLGDRTVPPQEAIALGRRIEAITAHQIDGLGHLMHEEEPERLADIIRALARSGAVPESDTMNGV